MLRGDDPQAEPYVSKTANLRRRLHRLLGPPDQTRRLNLRDRVRTVEFTATGSDFESGFLLYRVLRSCFPKTYTDRLRIRFAPLIKLHMENEYPRASITTRLGRLGGRSLYYGPFPSRTAAEKFANDSLDFFKMRRCIDDLHPDPAFPGCIYSEMKMCLAPCFKGCTDDDYRTEVGRVQAFFDSGGDSLVREITAQREKASSDLEFENAAALHTRVEKLKPRPQPASRNRAPHRSAHRNHGAAVSRTRVGGVFLCRSRTDQRPAHFFNPSGGAHQISVDGEPYTSGAGHDSSRRTEKRRSKSWSISHCSSAGSIAAPEWEKSSLRTRRVDCLCADWCAALRVSIAEKNQRLLHCRARRDGRRLPPWPSEARRGFAYKTF